MKRKIIVEIATSADGHIARPDGNVDWLSYPKLKGDHGLAAFTKNIDTILWGRKTVTKGLEMGMQLSWYGGKTKHYLFSRNLQSPPLPGFELVREPIKAFAGRLRARRGKHVWMMGGAEIIGAFLDEGEIDEFSIHVIPILIGEGIPLIAPRHRLVPLKLMSTKRYPDGVVHLNYRVLPKAKNGRLKAPSTRIPTAWPCGKQKRSCCARIPCGKRTCW